MEAMALGIPVIAGHRFEDTFGAAAIYCDPDEVDGWVEKLWREPSLYHRYAQAGRDFVSRNCAPEVVQGRLLRLLRGV